MYLRRILFSFVLLSGATFLVVPFSVFASDFCVAEVSPIGPSDCPAGSSIVTNTCVPGAVGSVPEHTCSSSVDPCLVSSGRQCLSACGSGDFRANGCDSSCVASPGTVACVVKTTFSTVAGGGVTSNCGVTGKPACCTAPGIPTGCVNATCGTPTTPACTGTPPTGSTVITTVKNPLAFSTVEGVLGSVLNTLQAIIVVLALISIVIGGILYITSAGNDEQMKTAKGAITAAAIGLALGLAAPSFLKQIGLILGWTAAIDCPATLPTADMATCQAAQAALALGKPLSAIALSALQFLLSVVGVLGIIMLVIGGLTYLTSAGNEERSESGKKIVTYAIIGIAVALASLIAVTQIAGLFV